MRPCRPLLTTSSGGLYDKEQDEVGAEAGILQPHVSVHWARCSRLTRRTVGRVAAERRELGLRPNLRARGPGSRIAARAFSGYQNLRGSATFTNVSDTGPRGVCA
jgi:hypothetical protein